MADPDRRKRIAILGGGVGAMAAAFELTEDPHWRDKYEITVYQLGWRLGGKGASGRNQRLNDRIEEHGLHLWFGYYENAFNMIQRVYKALDRPPGAPLATWEEAFHKHSLFVIGEFRDSSWSQWALSPPEFDGQNPGDGDIPPLWELLDRLLAFLHHHFETLSTPEVHAAVTGKAEHPSWLASLLSGLEADAERTATGVAGLSAARGLAQTFKADNAAATPEALKGLVDGVEHFFTTVWAAVEGAVHGAVEAVVRDFPTLYQLVSVMELGFYALKGMIADDVPRYGFDPLDAMDLREWLASHGAGPLALDCDLLRAAYESIFAYQHGSYALPNLAAGTALRGILRLCFTYKGAFAWKMQAGMGDTIFAPFHLVLRDRGVRFEYFSKVKALVPSQDGTRIDKIVIGRQATVLGDTYDPLYGVKDLPCWPAEPLYDQLKEGAAIKASFEKTGLDLESYWSDWPDVGEETLVDGEQFDEVVLGISRGLLPMICKGLIDQKPAWADMITHVRTVQTQACQVWSNADVVSLGWPAPPPGQEPTRPVFGGFAQPHNTIADMSHLIGRENWPADNPPKAIFYFCGPLTDPPDIPDRSEAAFALRSAENVDVRAAQWIRTDMPFLYPKSLATGYPGAFPDSFDFSILYTPGPPPPPSADSTALGTQFSRANVNPTERYVVSLKGSTQYRLKASASGYDNLTLAGDWTRTGLNYGCVEAAVMSGMEASRAICGRPTIIFGENYPLAC